jgi:hypothetical protein
MGITLFIEDGKIYANLSDLKLWEKNPRGIMVDDFQRLKKQLLKLGQYKPLLIISDGTTLGGNMRDRGYIDLLKEYDEIGVQKMVEKYQLDKEVFIDDTTDEEKIISPVDHVEKIIAQIKKGIWVSIVKADTDKEKLEYALSDNNRAGYYEMESVVGLLSEYPDSDFSDYSVEIGEPLNIQELVDYKDKELKTPDPEIDPNDLGKKLNMICPRCGFEFEHKKHEENKENDDI